MTASVPGPLWLCLRFPRLSLDLVQRGAPQTSTAIAIIDKQRVSLANDVARARGVAPGMTLASAYALDANLAALERQPARERRALQSLAHWAYQFTPAVCPQPPDSLLLEIGGSLRLFGGLSRLRQRIDSELAQRGFCYRGGLAHTPKAAQVFSLSHEKSVMPALATEDCRPPFFLRQLAPCPLAQLALTEQQRQQIEGLGLTTIGELLALPRADLGKRFGQGLLTYLAQLTGERSDPQVNIEPPTRFDSEVHFLSGLSTIDMLKQPIQQLLAELHQFLSRRQLHCRCFHWRFFHIDKCARQLTIELARGQDNPHNFLDLTLLKLETLTLASAVETVRLSAHQLQPATADNHALFRELAGPGNGDPWFLLDKLRGRLGNESVFSLQLQDEHLPELQQVKVAPAPAPKGHRVARRQQKKNARDAQRSIEAEKQHTHDQDPRQPLWLYEPPQPLRRCQQQLYFAGPLELISGPQRYDSHWWQARQQRDYFIARHQSGAHYWIYYDHHQQHWFVHGVFG